MSEAARLAVAHIEADLVDRRGLRQAWEGIEDHAVTCEILGAWAAIVDRFIDTAVAEAREKIARELAAVPGTIYADVAAKMIREGRLGK